MTKKRKGVKGRVQRGGTGDTAPATTAPVVTDSAPQNAQTFFGLPLCVMKGYFETCNLISAIIFTVIFIIGIVIEAWGWYKGYITDNETTIPGGGTMPSTKTFVEIFDFVMLFIVILSWGMYYFVKTRGCDSPYIIYLCVWFIITVISGIIIAIK